MDAIHATLVDLLRWRARNASEHEAFVFLADDGSATTLTWGELDRQARSVAARLRHEGTPGDRVLLLYPPGLQFHAAFLGCLYAGMIAVPAYPPDAMRLGRSLPRLRAVIDDAGASVVLTDPMIAAGAQTLFEETSVSSALCWVSTDGAAGEDSPWQDPGVDPDTVAFLQYTSGSTGKPKGVVLTHGNLIHNQSVVQRTCASGDRSIVVSWLPVYHDMGICTGLLQPLYAGCRSVIMSPLTFLQRPFEWLAAITRYGGTHTAAPNFAFDLCVRKVGPEQRAALDLSSWEVAIVGSEPVRRDTLQRFAEAFSACGFRNTTFLPSYGLAEATLLVSTGRPADPPVYRAVDKALLSQRRVRDHGGRPETAAWFVGCGVSVPDQEIRLVDPESRSPCPADAVGEIWVSGPSVAQGFWRRDRETEETFRAHVAGTDEGPYLRTGDLGFVFDGELFITSRLKDLIIVRGRNYHPSDIEVTAEKSHPAVRRGCCAAFSVDVDGGERTVVVAELDRRALGEGGGSSAWDEVLAAIRRAVTVEHELTVSAVQLLSPGTIPKTSSGKIQRHACRTAFLDGTGEVVAEWRAAVPAGEPEAGGLESALRGVTSPARRRVLVTDYVRSQVARVLGVEARLIEVDRPFAELGLDSMSAVELKDRLEIGLGVSLAATIVFSHPTIESLALLLARKTGLESRDGDRPAGDAHARRTVRELDDVAEREASELLEAELKALERPQS